MWMWGSQQLPQDTDYRYLGVQLSADCGWKKHGEVLKDKCLRMKGMLGGVFRNKCLDNDVKRIMLLAVSQASSGIWRHSVACQCPPAGCSGVCATPDPEQHRQAAGALRVGQTSASWSISSSFRRCQMAVCLS
jgi:hypothetical protein